MCFLYVKIVELRTGSCRPAMEISIGSIVEQLHSAYVHGFAHE